MCIVSSNLFERIFFVHRSDFKFVADRLIRMVIEEGLNQLPYTEVEVTTPTGNQIAHGPDRASQSSANSKSNLRTKSGSKSLYNDHKFATGFTQE